MGLKWPKAKLLPQTIKVRYVHYRGRNVQIAHLLFLKSARFYLAKVYVMQKVFLQKCLTHRIQQQINKLHKSLFCNSNSNDACTAKCQMSTGPASSDSKLAYLSYSSIARLNSAHYTVTVYALPVQCVIVLSSTGNKVAGYKARHIRY